MRGSRRRSSSCTDDEARPRLCIEHRDADIVGQTVPFKAVGDTDAEMITAVLVNHDATP